MKKITNISEKKFLIEIIENNIVLSRALVNENIIESLEVNEKFRNISFGKKTLNYIIEELANRNYDKIIVEKYNSAILHFLYKNSFVLENNKLILKDIRKEKNEKNQLIKTSVVALSINILLAILKILIGLVFQLNTIIADGINSATDSLSTILAIVGLKISSKLEDDKHPFGYGKIEAIFNLFIGFLIFITTGSVFLASIKKIFYHEKLNLDKNSILIYSMTLLFIIFKFLQYLYVSKYANKYKNEVLLTLSKDYLIDILLSSTVLVGVILTIKFSYIYDVILSILISLYVMYQAYNIVKENILTLLEIQDEKLIRKVKTIILQNENIFYVHDLFMIRSAKNIYMYADVRMDKNFSVQKSHKIAEDVSLVVRNKFKNIKSLNLHIEPVYK